MLKRFLCLFLIVGLGVDLMAQQLIAQQAPRWSADVLAGSGKSAKRSQPYSAGQPHGDHVELGNPFGIEIMGDDVWVTTVDDSCVWKCDLEGKGFVRVAGNGTIGYSGDGGPAVEAQMNWPHEVRVDSLGNLFIADTRNHVIRKVDAKTGIITTLAGSGRPGFADGRGSEAQFNQPHSVVLDGSGGVLVADTKNHRLRRIEIATGEVTTISGTGKGGLPTDGEAAMTSLLIGPRSLAVDRDWFWLVLREGNSVWKIDRANHTIHHVAGTGKKGHGGNGLPAKTTIFNGPKGIAVSPRGVFIVDTENHAVRMIDQKTGLIDTVLGPQSSLPMKLKRPHGIAPTKDGFLLGDSEMHRVVRWRDER